MRTAAFGGQAPVLLERPTKLCAAAPARPVARPSGQDADCRKLAGAGAGCALAAQRRARVKGDSDVLLGAVLSALHLRGIASKAPLSQAQQSALEDTLSEVVAIYRLTTERHRQMPGHAALSRMPSRRLFGGLLEPEAKAATTCRPPNPVQQETDDLPALLEHACGAQALLQSAVAPSAAPDSWPAGQVIVRPEGVPSASFAFNPGPMSREEAEAEAQVLFRPAAGKQACRHLLSIARLTLVFEGCEALQVGVAHLLRRLTVVAVLNLYPAPSRLGEQSVRMLMVVGGGGRDGAAPAHVCELRLEELAWWQARGAARRHLDQFHAALRATHGGSSSAASTQALSCLVRSVLSRPPEGRSLRAFRCRLAKRYGSTVAAWRSAFGGDWHASFAAFQKHFQTVLPREEAAVRWMELDAGLASTVSLFELDPEAPVLLERLRRSIAAASSSYAEEAELEACDSYVDRLFEVMAFECCRRGAIARIVCPLCFAGLDMTFVCRLCALPLSPRLAPNPGEHRLSSRAIAIMCARYGSGRIP
ncbi:unnamed protein product [Prorocentrum cordatum]|uniref:Uncharacterized protein n=1 Tax=Prorocentrum cordatum TaxID=2364126 RepID=A0ABN9T1F9_9DINO|nr:unnamed protein product [Polarella glacialis]